MSGAWLRRKVRHPCRGGPRRLTMTCGPMRGGAGGAIMETGSRLVTRDGEFAFQCRADGARLIDRCRKGGHKETPP